MEFNALCSDHGMQYVVYPPLLRRLRYVACRLFLPRAIFHPALRHLPCQGMIVDLFSQLILHRTRYTNCQLSYLISDSTQGIIIGFPTTASMTLVSAKFDASFLQTQMCARGWSLGGLSCLHLPSSRVWLLDPSETCLPALVGGFSGYRSLSCAQIASCLSHPWLWNLSPSLRKVGPRVERRTTQMTLK